jgi:hypothetical protein
MEAVVRITEGGKLPDYLEIPTELKKEQVQVVIIPFPKAEAAAKPKVNGEALKKFQSAARSGWFKEHLKEQLAQGVKFEFDAQKIIDGAETEAEKQARFRMEKSAWQDNAAQRAGRGEL